MYKDDIQSLINSGAGKDATPTIERGSYGDRGTLEANRPDGVGKPGESGPAVNTPPNGAVTPKFYAQVAVDQGSKLTKHSIEIAGMLGTTAHYLAPQGGHPSTGSRYPDEPADDDYARSGVEQQDVPDKDND